jgi:DNA polymerase-3 subunit alpha
LPQYFYQDGEGGTFLEKAIKYGAKYQENENSSQVSLFGEASDVQIPEPLIPPCEEWPTMEKLAKEKEVVGIYISGHPLDDFKNDSLILKSEMYPFVENIDLTLDALY